MKLQNMSALCLCAFLVFCAVISGCANNRGTGVVEHIRLSDSAPGSVISRSAEAATTGDSDAAPEALLIDVPFFSQTDRLCGAASLASVYNYYGMDISLNKIADNVYEESLKGALMMDLFLFSKQMGFDVTYYTGSLDDLKQKLRAGTPVIIFLNLGLTAYPVGHYIVVVGYNDREGAVFAHSSSEKQKAITYKKLVKGWRKTDFSTLLITPRNVPDTGPAVK